METIHHANTAGRFEGVEAGAKVTDWSAVIRQKQALVDELRIAKYIDVLPNYNNIAYLEGVAQFQSNGSIIVDGTPIKANKVVIATGSRPHIPDIDGLADVDWLDSTSALELQSLPSSLTVMGGGYIGVEMAQIFARAGTKVTIVTRRGLLPEAEPEVSSALQQYFAAEGIEVLSGLSYQRVSSKNNQVSLFVSKDDKSIEVTSEKLLLATGRIPNTENLALAVAGIKTDAHNGIIVDAQMRTSCDGVYAAGDVTGRDQFVYMAAYGAKLAAQNAMNGTRLAMIVPLCPQLFFPTPKSPALV